MKWLLTLQAAAITAISVACMAQESRPLRAPDDISLDFQVQTNRHDFRVGEVIPIEYSFVAIPGRYLYLNRIDKLISGRAFGITCTPQPAQQPQNRGDSARFQQMLADPECSGVGVGGGIGGGCGDCDGEIPVSTTPIHFQAQLNQFVRLRQPGTYSCTASSAEITSVSPSGSSRPALLVESNPVEIRIADDPGWALSAALAYTSAFESQCRDDALEGQRLLNCFDISAGLAYLDTPDSVAAIIRLFDGRQHSWDAGFWTAIESSSHRDEVLRMMTARIQDPDTEVQSWLLSSLAMWALKAELPDAFETTTPPSTYSAQAQQQLRKYVRLLGDSLGKKSPTVLEESARTYRMFAEMRFCSGETLIPEGEKTSIVVSSKRRR